jgi:SAM-dependent methyltransferase
MGKHHPLTIKELDEYLPNPETLRFIETYCEQKNIKKEKIKILDWGCGRGREVIRFNMDGLIVFGTDIDDEPIQNGLVLARELGLRDDLLQTLRDGCKTSFEDNYFDLIYSNQVFEHVKDIKQVAAELRRILKKGGECYHVFPAFLYPNEGHLHMPFVHWIPKNILRYFVIYIYVSLNREPFWAELDGMDRKGRAEVYYKYSIEKTYYRSPSALRRIFEDAGFSVTHGKANISGMLESPAGPITKLKQLVRTIFWEEELHLILK